MSGANSIDYKTLNNTDYLIEQVNNVEIRIIQLEAMITGLQEAMRPLLTEWSQLKKEEKK